MSKRFKQVVRSIALTMTFVLVVYFLPLHGSAVLAEISPNITASSAETKTEEVAPSVLCEDESLREENVKHFIMNNHTYRAVVYSTPVHYQKDGKWVDIDNTLTEQSALSEEDFSGHITTDGPFKVKFANNVNSSKLVRIDKDGYRLSWAYQSATKRNVNGAVKAKVSTNDKTIDAVANASSTVTYDYVEENSSLQYEVNPTCVKENIIVHSSANTYAYTFEFKVKGVSLNQCEDGSIEAIANDTGEVVFIIPKPFMTDAEGRYSEDVAYTLSNFKNNKVTLTVTADQNWINSDETVFPVTIDPIITTAPNRADIETTYVASGDKNQSFAAQHDWRSVGYDEASGLAKTRTLVRFNLPSLNKGDVVTYADVALRLYDSSLAPEANAQITAHVVTESWAAATTTWDTQPSYDSYATDYSYITDVSQVAEWKRFDVTGAVKDWYETDGDSNYGILIKAKDETALVSGRFNSEMCSSSEDAAYKYPVLLIEYRNHKGLENYWTYTSASAGTAGTMYVNDYSGNLIFVAPLFSSPSELMPLSLYAVYNSYASNLLHVAGHDYSTRTTVARGWRLNIQQTLLTADQFDLSGDALECYPYVYTDADGTDHYFVQKTTNEETVYVDEDGLGLTLTIGDTMDFRYCVTDRNDNKMMFNSVGNLRRIEDANGNRIAVVYKDASGDLDSGKRIDYVVDGVNHKYTFHYVSDDPTNDNVQYITDHYGRRIVFARVAPSILEEIRYYDGTKAAFTYEDEAPRSMLTVVNDADYRLKVDYAITSVSHRVSKIREYSAVGSSGTRALGQTVSFDRSKHNTTVIRTNGSDDEYNTNDDMLTTCHFDNAGRLTSSYTQTVPGTFVGAGISRYTDVLGVNDVALNQQNRLLATASFGRNVTDYITNSNFESNWSGWTDAQIDADTTFEVSDSDSYFGKKSAKISVSSVTAQTGRAMYSQDIAGLTPGGTYTFSAYVKTEDMEKVYTGSHDGAFLRLYTQDSDTPTNAYSEHIAEDTDTAFDKGWKRLTATITLPGDCTEVRAYIQLRNMTGTVYVDGAQLEKGEHAHPVNLLENAGFDKATAGMPSSWTSTNVSYTTSGSTVAQGVTDAYSRDGGHSIRITGDAEKDKCLSQEVPVSGNFNETYTISGWANGHGVSSSNHLNTTFEISVSVQYRKDDGTYRTENKPSAKFNHTITGWQYAAQVFSVASVENAEDVPVKIIIKAQYSHQCNSAYFDNFQLLRDSADSYTYDNDGNMVSVSGNAQQEAEMEYDGSDLLSITDNLGYQFEYTYDNHHNLTMSKSAGDVYTFYWRNENGQIEDVIVQNDAESSRIHQTINYTEETGNIQFGAHVASIIDQHGRTTAYTYDSRERLASVVAPDGDVVTYTYVSDSNDRVASVQTTRGEDALGVVTYTYDRNRLSELAYGDDIYAYSVDRFGKPSSTTINGKTLSTNTYAARNGKLASVTYGNGNVLTYTYNWRGQLLGINNGSHYIYRYIYDLNGTLTEFIDNLAARKTLYVQDSLGRPVRQTLQSLEGDHIGAVEYGYDQRNNVNRLAINFGGHTHTARYLYTAIDEVSGSARYAADNLPTQYRYSGNRYANYTYTSLNLLSERIFTTEEPLLNRYTYSESGHPEQVGLQYKTTQLKTERINDVVYEYAYDLSGNIILVKKGTSGNLVNYRAYTYDGLDRLTGEIHYDSTGAVTKTIEYGYDSYGNILSRMVNGETINYAYGTDDDAGWTKMLKSYDGQSIDYDEIGNPIAYRGATLTWGNGRQLKKYQTADTTATYNYDDAGMRTRKTVNGVESTYLYLNGKLHGEVRDGHHIHYSYDSYGNLSVIKYYKNDTDYNIFYVMTNVFGDVVSLHNANGTMVASYEYDSWGNVISMTDTTGIGIATINPIRYRGYYYDTESGFYYLPDGYYDPETCRFVNARENAITLAQNVFAYCQNNPVIMSSFCVLGSGSTAGAGMASTSIVGGKVPAANGVVVISNREAEWMVSSSVMGCDFAAAAGAQYSRVVAVITQTFATVWDNITEKYVIIHTHGTPDQLDGMNFFYAVSDLSTLSENSNIEIIIMTSCATGGDNGEFYNVGRMLSTKISPMGIVICSTTDVWGDDTSFEPELGGQWVIYRNGILLPSNIQRAITMPYIYDYIAKRYA